MLTLLGVVEQLEVSFVLSVHSIAIITAFMKKFNATANSRKAKGESCVRRGFRDVPLPEGFLCNIFSISYQLSVISYQV